MRVVQFVLDRGPADVSTSYSASRRARFRQQSSIDPAKLDYDADVAVLWSSSEQIEYLRPHFEREFSELAQIPKAHILRRLLKEDLVLHPGIRARVDEFRSRNFRGRTAGVHIRLSDRRVPLEPILIELEALLNREPRLGIFAATDNIEAKELLEERYDGVITTPHWYPAAGEPVHQNRACPDRAENGIDALVDLYLLSECDYLIGDSTSSFARVAGLLRRGPEAEIIDVKLSAQASTVPTHRLRP
jgi:hypothetical protein